MTIHLHPMDGDDDIAVWMTRCAVRFAEQHRVAGPGVRNGEVFATSPEGDTRAAGRRCLAYWTRSRAVVVRELF